MNKKGFTLTELLVVVVILGIISGLSIPLIRNLTSKFEKKKYQSYADSVLAASKIYNDSYSEDLFGHNEYGCAYIPYDKLVEKNLIKDIEVEDMSCNSDRTYVRVIKQKDKYGYAVYLSCGKKTKGRIETTKISIPTIIPAMDNDVCTGTDPSNIIIETVEAQSGGNADKNRKKTKIQLKSSTGLNPNMIIYAKWSSDENDHSPAGFEKIDFKVKGNQEEMLLNGETVTSVSNELITPKDNGAYYIILRVDRLEDLYGHPWKNPREEGSKYISFGPFMIDNTSPTVLANVYKCDASRNKTGESVANKTHMGEKTVFDLSSMSTAVDGWANSTNFKDGVCLEFTITDNEMIKSTTWEWNEDNQAIDVTDYKGFSTSRRSSKEYNGEKSVIETHTVVTDGHRYLRLTIKDYAGNKTVLDIDLKLDRVAPAAPSIQNPSNGNWTNQNVKLVMGASDRKSNSDTTSNGISGMGKYYYTYNSDATAVGTNDAIEWVLLSKGNNKKSFDDTWSAERENTVYIKACDKAGNCSSKSNTPIRIDKTAPVIALDVYKRNSSGNKANSTILKSHSSATSSAVNLSSINGNVDGWLNNNNYPDGVYFEFNISDNFTLNTRHWEHNATGKPAGTSNYATLTSGGTPTAFSSSVGKSTTYANYLSGDGLRYARLTVTDKAGNSAYLDIDVKIDKGAPAAPTITNPKEDTWTNQSVKIKFAGSDTISGIGKYYYTYNSSATEIGTNDGQYWVNLARGTNKASFEDTWAAERDDTLYAKVCDKAGNCSNNSTTKIKIDTTAPTISAKSYKRNSDESNGSSTNVEKTVSSGTSTSTNTMDLSNATGNYNGWLNKSKYEYGVNLDITIKDTFLKSAKFEWNDGGYSGSDTGYKNLSNNTTISIPSNATSKTYSDYFASDGHRYAKMTVTDRAGNTTAMYFDMLIDNTSPDCYFETWDEYDEDGVDVGTWCANPGPSGCASNYYTFYDKTSSFEDNVHDNAGNYGYCWISIDDYDCGHGYSSYLHHESVNGKESCPDACGGSKMVSNFWNGNIKIDQNCGAGDCHYCDRSSQGTTGMVCCECWAGWAEATCYYHP